MNVFMAVAMDLGNPNSSFGSIHPTDKKDVGSRLAIAGLSIAYDENLYYTGPLIDAVREHTQSFPFTLEVIFKSVDVQIEVRSADGFEVCIVYIHVYTCKNAEPVTSFQQA